jgi:O-acetyl-ADP-ribose deacetylase (regulator of RNase III)
MIEYVKGNILNSDTQALVNTVNTEGVMGKGIALRFKESFPQNFKEYRKACEANAISIGKLFVTKHHNLSGEKIIINFPTKQKWRNPSEYAFIEKGLEDLIRVIREYNIKSIALPPLGAGNGGLNWQAVKKMIENKLSGLNIKIVIYEPTEKILENLKKERVKLTDARALMLYLCYELVKQGEFVSEFSAEKICYFLSRFGADKWLKLKFQPKFYGPYSGKVRYLLKQLNGSYITGFGEMNTKAFEPLLLVNDGYEDVCAFIDKNKELKEIAEKTAEFLDGWYSDFALELLSTIDFIMNSEQIKEKERIIERLNHWSERKKEKFTNPYHIDLAVEHVERLTKKLNNEMAV